MAHDLATLLGPHGVARTADLVLRVDRHSIGEWIARGRLLRPYPGVVVLPERLEEWHTRALAAVYATRGAVSHTSALTLWRLARPADPIHVSVPARRRSLEAPGLVVHRVRRLLADRLGPYTVTDVDRALVDSWGLAFGATGGPARRADVRGAVITALRERRVRIGQVHAEAARRPALPGSAELRSLLQLIEQGCQSELEIWGVLHVLRGRGMPPIVQQHRVALPGGAAHLDAAIPELKIAIELDGAAFHGSAADRERDTRRDVALAALGWIVLRFSYRRLTTEPDACRREIIAVCQTRAALLSGR